MKKTTNFDAFAQFADAQLSKEEMKNIKGGVGGTLEGGDGGSGSVGGIKGGGDTGGGGVVATEDGGTCYNPATKKFVPVRYALSNGECYTSDATSQQDTCSSRGYTNCIKG